MSQLSPADPIVILSYARTPMGAMQGALAEVPATALGAVAVKAAVERAGVAGEDIDRAYIGCVLPAGLGQAPARQAAILAGLPVLGVLLGHLLGAHPIRFLLGGGLGGWLLVGGVGLVCGGIAWADRIIDRVAS